MFSQGHSLLSYCWKITLGLVVEEVELIEFLGEKINLEVRDTAQTLLQDLLETAIHLESLGG